jgi:hypothetical protein
MLIIVGAMVLLAIFAHVQRLRQNQVETVRVRWAMPSPAGLQAVPPDAQTELKRLIPDAAHAKAERQRRLQERIAQRQQKLEEIQKSRVPDTAGASSGTASGTEDISLSPSPTPQ